MPKDHRPIIAMGMIALGAGHQASALEVPEPPHQQVELGLGHVSEDSARFGRYNGHNQKGIFAIGNVDARVYQGDGYYGAVRGSDLGQTSRALRIEGGQQGAIGGFLDFNQLDVHNTDSTVTPFQGDDSLRLPELWIRGDTTSNMPLLDSSLNSVDLETQRKRYGGGLSIVPGKDWSFDVSFHREEKHGTGQTSGSLSFLDAASVLPEPVDYTTDDLEAILGYALDKGQLQLAYHMSLFSDKNNALRWDNPFSQGFDQGQLALPPDNQFHQVSLSGGYRLPYHTRLTGLASIGLMRQDDAFLPFSINPSVNRALPGSRLNGKVYVTAGRLQLHSRPLPKWNYTASLRFYDRDNDTPRDDYAYVIDDQFPGGTRRNPSYSYRQKQLELRAGYRMNRRVRLSLGYRFEDTSRNRAEVHDTHDNTIKAAVRAQARDDLSVSVRVSGSRRSESGNYRQLLVTTNPNLRVSYLSKRKQAKVGTSLNYTPIPRISLGAGADYVYDHYDDTEVGLRNNAHITYNLDLSYAPVEHITTYAFYTHDNSDAKQRGSAAGDARDWTANTGDTADTFGIGVKWDSILTHLDIGADYVYNRAKGRVGLQSNGDYPNLNSVLNSFKVYGRYHLKKNLELKLTYLHENFDSDDWAIDGVTPNTIDQVLSLGGKSPNYDADVIALSMVYKLF